MQQRLHPQLKLDRVLGRDEAARRRLEDARS
jgi:hypothetical protein